MTEPRDADFEREFGDRLRAHLDRAVRPVDAERLVDRLARSTASRSGLRAWAAVAAVATVLAAGILTVASLPLLSRPSPRPAPSQPASPLTTAKPSTSASASPILSGPAVDAAGSIGTGGIWARRGSSLYTSTDGGATWHTGSADPTSYAIEVFDASHAWTVALSPGSSQDTGSPTDVLHFTVNRTSDGGKTWTPVALAGNFAAMRPVLSFPDLDHGFLLFSPGRFATQPSSIYRTDDGGATWRQVGSAPALGPEFFAGDTLELFAGAAESAAPVRRWPTLAESQDGGVTWHDVPLPAYLAAVLAPPTFFESDGVMPVVDDQGTVRLWGTHDGGRTWSEVQRGLYLGQIGPGAFFNRDLWILASRDGYGTFAIITRNGTQWDALRGRGLPVAAPSWISFVDASQSAELVLLAPLGDTPAPEGLFLTRDGGRTWTPARLPPG